MSNQITEDDIPLGYSSEPDEYESELVLDSPLAAEPFEIYIGNTGKVSFEEYFSLFKPYGIIENATFWRTHNHLYHARIVFRSKSQSDHAIKMMNGRKAFGKRIRVTYVKDRVDLDFPAAIRIDDISADVTEEDIFDHFLSCGSIRFVIKTGYAAYIQFAHSSSVVKALELEMILNGDPYTVTRISADDRIYHIQVIENMKDIKYRKPFVMVENYPELPKGTPLCQYKSNFESVGPVRHFKIAPTAGGTVTLALCMDTAEDRNLLIDRFNDTIISGKRLKLYIGSGKARMKVIHVAKYAICKNSITVDGIRPYYKDYDVCLLFRSCGSISFLEKLGNRWIICFDHASTVALALHFNVFSLYKKVLVIQELNQHTFQVGKSVQLEDSEYQAVSYPKQIVRKTDESSKKNLVQSTRSASPEAVAKQHTAKKYEEQVKTRESRKDVRVSPDVRSKPSTSQPSKRSATEDRSNVRSTRDRKNSTNDHKPSARKSDEDIKSNLLQTTRASPPDAAAKQKTAKEVEKLGKTRESRKDERVTPDDRSKPSTSKSTKRPVKEEVVDSRSERDRQNSTAEATTRHDAASISKKQPISFKIAKKTDEKPKPILLQTTIAVPPGATAKQATVANQEKEIDALLKTRHDCGSISKTQAVSYLEHITRKTDEYVKQNLIQSTEISTSGVAANRPTVAIPAKQFKTHESRKDVKVTPEVRPKQNSTNDVKLSARKPDEDIRPIFLPAVPQHAAAKPPTVVHQEKHINALVTPQTHINAGVAPQVLPGPSTSQPVLDRQKSTNENALLEAGNKFLVTINNLPKGIEENDLRELFGNHKMNSVSLFCSKDLYYPTSTAYIRFSSKKDLKAAILQHHSLYRRKRICIQEINQAGFGFQPDRSIMLKNLPKNFSEEDIVKRLKKLLWLKVEDVIKPAYHYAYVDFAGNIKVHERLLTSLREALTPFKIDVFPLYRKLPKMLIGNRSYVIREIDKLRPLLGAVLKEETNEADKEFGAHNAHKLFVGNIPRDTETEDVVDYFNNFGSIIDYTPIEKKSCCLRKSAILTFLNPKHAQNAYCQQLHFLEGSLLDVHIMDTPPVQFSENAVFQLFTVKFHSRFLTNDEIRQTLQKFISINHHIRFDAFDDRANYVANSAYCNASKHSGRWEELLNVQYINDEAVKIVKGYDPTPPTEDEAQEKRKISTSPHRQQKEAYLKFAVDKENLKEGMKVCSMPIKASDIPFKPFYTNNSVQINNVSLDTTLEDIRDLFIKCGDIVDYRALLLKEDATKICYVKFKTGLAADLACAYSQRMLKGKRILVHLARNTLQIERARSILVERLSSSTTAEQLYDVFTSIGTVKYVQKQSPSSAIVCFKDKDMLQAFKVKEIPNSESFVISPCYGEYDPCLFNKFTHHEELIPMTAAEHKPRILPEFHQLELERKVFKTLPDDIKTQLINEVFLAREQLPNFNQLSKSQQIDALKTKYQDFTQREHFLRLTALEQKKLLDVTSNLQQDYPYEEVLPPASKRARTNEPVNEELDQEIAANWDFIPSEETEPTFDPYSSDFEPQQETEPLVTDTADWYSEEADPTIDPYSSDFGPHQDTEPMVADAANWYSEEADPTSDPYASDFEIQQNIDPLEPDDADWYPSEDAELTSDLYLSELGPQQGIEPLVTTMDTSHVSQAFPPSGFHGYPEINRPPGHMGPRPRNMYPQGGGPRFPNMYPRQGPPQFGPRMPPPFRGPNQQPMMRPGPRPMMRPGPRPMMRPGPGPMMRPGPRPMMRPGPGPMMRPGPRPMMRPGPGPMMRPGPGPMLRPGPGPMMRPGPNPMMRPGLSPMMRPPMRMRPPMVGMPPAGGRPPDRRVMLQGMAAMAYNGP